MRSSRPIRYRSPAVRPRYTPPSAVVWTVAAVALIVKGHLGVSWQTTTRASTNRSWPRWTQRPRRRRTAPAGGSDGSSGRSRHRTANCRSSRATVRPSSTSSRPCGRPRRSAIVRRSLSASKRTSGNHPHSAMTGVLPSRRRAAPALTCSCGQRERSVLLDGVDHHRSGDDGLLRHGARVVDGDLVGVGQGELSGDITDVLVVSVRDLVLVREEN